MSYLRVRIDGKTLDQANRVTERPGTSTQEMIRILVAKIASTEAVPLELSLGDDPAASPWEQRAAALEKFYDPAKAGGVCWVDLGMKAKPRPLLVVSREDPDAERALAVCVPRTTEIRGGRYEVRLPRVKWLPGARDGVANVPGVMAVEHHRLNRRAGRFDPSVVPAVRDRIAWMLEIK